MKHLLLASSAALFLATLSCAQNGPAASGSGGSQGTGSGGSVSSTGGSTSTGTGGTTASGSGGSTGAGTGGTTSASGGSTGAGTGGTTTTGTGGQSAGSGGAGPGSGGSSTGSGGVTGSGGSLAGSGGATGSGGAGTGVGGATVAAIVPTLDGFLWTGNCSSGTGSKLDCPILDDQGNGCPAVYDVNTPYANRGVKQIHTHTVGGTAGTKYMINFEVRGIVGFRCYTGGKPAVTTVIPDFEGLTGNNGWYEGGTPTDSKWNTYEIHVSPPVPGAANVYYLNSVLSTSAYCERHETFVMKYTASFPVMAGGTIQMVMHDSNCLGQQNCGGIDNQSSCAMPRSVDLTGMSPPATFMQPILQNTFHPQWLYFDVKSVAITP